MHKLSADRGRSDNDAGGTMRTAPVIRSCSGSIISRGAKIEKQSRSRVNGTRARVTPGGCWVSI